VAAAEPSWETRPSEEEARRIWVPGMSTYRQKEMNAKNINRRVE
jgi:hypothetical protein